MWLVIVPRGHDRLCALQCWFVDGKRRRDYVIMHRRPESDGRARKEGGWWVGSLATVIQPVHLDLRNPAHAKRLETQLVAINVEQLEAVLREKQSDSTKRTSKSRSSAANKERRSPPAEPRKKRTTVLDLEATDEEIQEALDALQK
jgi:hypothetical protein